MVDQHLERRFRVQVSRHFVSLDRRLLIFTKSWVARSKIMKPQVPALWPFRFFVVFFAAQKNKASEIRVLSSALLVEQKSSSTRFQLTSVVSSEIALKHTALKRLAFLSLGLAP